MSRGRYTCTACGEDHHDGCTNLACIVGWHNCKSMAISPNDVPDDCPEPTPTVRIRELEAAMRNEHARLLEFFYLLARDRLSWGDITATLRGLADVGVTVVYTSPAGEQLARENVQELLTGERYSRE